MLTPVEVVMEYCGYQGSNTIRYWLATVSAVGFFGLCCLSQKEAITMSTPITKFKQLKCYSFFLAIAGSLTIGLTQKPICLVGENVASCILAISSVSGIISFYLIVAVCIRRTLRLLKTTVRSYF
jgi:hypothetical protein